MGLWQPYHYSWIGRLQSYLFDIWHLTFACTSKNLVFVQQQLPKQWEKCGQFWPKHMCACACAISREMRAILAKNTWRACTLRGLALLAAYSEWPDGHFDLGIFIFVICVFQLVHLYLCICNYASNFTEKYVSEAWPCWLPAPMTRWTFWCVYLHFYICISIFVFQFVYLCNCMCAFHFTEKHVSEAWPCWPASTSDQIWTFFGVGHTEHNCSSAEPLKLFHWIWFGH